jgi:hypothetical protein
MIENIPVWPFDPNWTNSVGETLEWLTDVLVSPTGAEQRRSMRYYPRRMFNFTVATADDERNFFNNLLMSHGSMDWYLPIWHDVTITTAVSTTTVIPCIPSAGIAVGSVVFFKGETVYDFLFSEVSAVGLSSITLNPPLARTLPAGTLLHPMTKARLAEQPALTAMSDSVETAEVQFLVVAPSAQVVVAPEAGGLATTYRGFRVFTLQSDWSDSVERGQHRLIDVMETEMGISEQVDTARRPFPTQSHKWILDGKGDHAQFYALMQVLRGRATPVWVPTWMYDMRLLAPVASNATSLSIARSGFTLGGGPRPEREDIMIELANGTFLYRRIINSATDGAGNETILLDSPIPVGFPVENVVRICFMSLMRLDQDSVEIEHATDLDGVSEVQVTFRAAPNLRQSYAGNTLMWTLDGNFMWTVDAKPMWRT